MSNYNLFIRRVDVVVDAKGISFESLIPRGRGLFCRTMGTYSVLKNTSMNENFLNILKRPWKIQFRFDSHCVDTNIAPFLVNAAFLTQGSMDTIFLLSRLLGNFCIAFNLENVVLVLKK